MNQRIKKLWIKALRSGKYKQGVGILRADGAFCCLGVLCELHRQKFSKRWKKDRVDNYVYEGGSATLPETVMDWAGLDDDDPRLGRTKRAAQLNDSGKSFSYIADRIERYL